MSIELAKSVYRLTESFPETEKFGLTNQIKRASVSISSNIAEGSARFSPKDQARFYEIAYGSLMEVANQLILAEELSYLDKDANAVFKQKLMETAQKLNALHKSRIK